jgi:hypothetical protein
LFLLAVVFKMARDRWYTMMKKLGAAVITLLLVVAPPVSMLAQQCPAPTGAIVKTASYSALAGDTGRMLIFTCAALPCTYTLASPPPTAIWTVNVVNSSSVLVTILPNGLQINGQTGNLTVLPGSSMMISTDGSNYYAVVELGSTVTFKVWIAAAACNGTTAGPMWDLPTSAAPAVNCMTGVNLQQGTLDFAVGQSAQNEVFIPGDWSGAVDALVVFSDASTSGTVIWNIATSCDSTSGVSAGDNAFNAASAFSTVTLGNPPNAIWNVSSTSITMTGCVAGSYLHIKLSRAADTASSAARLRGLQLTFRRTIVI